MSMGELVLLDPERDLLSYITSAPEFSVHVMVCCIFERFWSDLGHPSESADAPRGGDSPSVNMSPTPRSILCVHMGYTVLVCGNLLGVFGASILYVN